MHGANSTDRVLLSLPHLVRWGGFVARTPELQRMGWELSAEHDPWSMGVRLAMRNQDYQMVAITNSVSAMHLHQHPHLRRMTNDPDEYLLKFDVVRMMTTRAMVEYVRESPYIGFKPIDAKPQFVDMHYMKSIDELIVFAPCMAETQELIVDEAEVSSILAKLIEAQKPEQERIRERRRLRESREGLMLDAEPRRKFHAQILSISA
jgi:hypothetical protein